MAGCSSQLDQQSNPQCSTELKLPMQSLVEEFKVAKARSFMTLRDSKDPVIKNTQSDVKTGRKWSLDEAVEEAESRLKHKEMVGATQLGRQGLGWTTHKWWSSSSDKERRELVTQELRNAEEEKRLAIAVGQAKQGAWTRWERVEQCELLSWSVMWQMEPLRIIISVQGNLRSTTNTSQYQRLV